MPMKCGWCSHTLYVVPSQVFMSGIGGWPEQPPLARYPEREYPDRSYQAYVPMVGCRYCGRVYAQVTEGQEPISPYVHGLHREGLYATHGGHYAYSAQPAYSATIVEPGQYVDPWTPAPVLME
jgi:hypothetical protein